MGFFYFAGRAKIRFLILKVTDAKPGGRTLPQIFCALRGIHQGNLQGDDLHRCPAAFTAVEGGSPLPRGYHRLHGFQ